MVLGILYYLYMYIYICIYIYISLSLSLSQAFGARGCLGLVFRARSGDQPTVGRQQIRGSCLAQGSASVRGFEPHLIAQSMKSAPLRGYRYIIIYIYTHIHVDVE